MRLAGERQWWSTLLLYVPQAVYAVPAVLLLLLAVWKRDRTACLFNAAALALVAGPLMGANVPLARWVTRRPPADSGRIRVLAYNVLGAQRGYDAVARQLRRYRPDVIVFSEAPDGSRGLELADTIRKLSPEWTPAQSGEMCLFSRWPVLEKEWQPLHSATLGERYRDKVRMRVRAPFGSFTVIGAHFSTALHGQTLRGERRHLPAYLDRAGAIRWEQAQDVLQWARAQEGPVIVAGDFNTPPAGHVYGALRRPYRDAFADAGWGWGFTYPSRTPLLRIDYILHSPSLRTVRCEVGPAPGSDHRPVFAELAYLGGDEEMRR